MHDTGAFILHSSVSRSPTVVASPPEARLHCYGQRWGRQEHCPFSFCANHTCEVTATLAADAIEKKGGGEGGRSLLCPLAHAALLQALCVSTQAVMGSLNGALALSAVGNLAACCCVEGSLFRWGVPLWVIFPQDNLLCCLLASLGVSSLPLCSVMFVIMVLFTVAQASMGI